MLIRDQQDLREKVQKHKFVVVHCDATWDGYAVQMREQIASVDNCLDLDIDFHEIDIDLNHELAASLNVMNVPSLAYFRDGVLVQTIIGLGQDIEQYLNSM